MSRAIYTIAFAIIGLMIGVAGFVVDAGQACAIVYSERVERFNEGRWTHRLLIDAERLDQSCSKPDVSVFLRQHGAIVRLPKSQHSDGVFLRGENNRAEIAILMHLPLQTTHVQTAAFYTGVFGISRPPAFSRFAEVPQP